MVKQEGAVTIFFTVCLGESMNLNEFGITHGNLNLQNFRQWHQNLVSYLVLKSRYPVNAAMKDHT